MLVQVQNGGVPISLRLLKKVVKKWAPSKRYKTGSYTSQILTGYDV